ncbi:hypothetical protein SEUCBS140593_010219 [Sporothrix eucalyptigena]|uniref:Zn(2)-C6 fungal-type domain-containing protein n=1 Tax=Sporothrix eucalyptigena TaxID=1812306 RepID=A0ABP0D0L1_9PEZI
MCIAEPLLPREHGGPGASAVNTREIASSTTTTNSTTANTAITSSSDTRCRSRNGCLTCKRRKVRCNEQRTWCYHFQKLRFDSTSTSTSTATSQMSQAGESIFPGARSYSADVNPSHQSQHSQQSGDPLASSDHFHSWGLFDFAQSIVDSTLDLSSFQDF